MIVCSSSTSWDRWPSQGFSEGLSRLEKITPWRLSGFGRAGGGMCMGIGDAGAGTASLAVLPSSLVALAALGVVCGCQAAGRLVPES